LFTLNRKKEPAQATPYMRMEFNQVTSIGQLMRWEFLGVSEYPLYRMGRAYTHAAEITETLSRLMDDGLASAQDINAFFTAHPYVLEGMENAAKARKPKEPKIHLEALRHKMMSAPTLRRA